MECGGELVELCVFDGCVGLCWMVVEYVDVEWLVGECVCVVDYFVCVVGIGCVDVE